MKYSSYHFWTTSTHELTMSLGTFCLLTLKRFLVLLLLSLLKLAALIRVLNEIDTNLVSGDPINFIARCPNEIPCSILLP